MLLHYLKTYFAILVSISNIKHLLNIILTHFFRKVSHDKLELGFCEKLVLDLVSLGSEQLWQWVCATQHLHTHHQQH